MKYICVFCGSSRGNRPIYQENAKKMGQILVKRGFGLVYGGGNLGLMGIIADTVLAAGGEVIGVIPEFLVSGEVAHSGLTKLHIVKSIHDRFAMMVELADAFVALPGGYGTFEEFCEVLTWAQLRLHQKPLALLNVEGYYDPLLGLFDNAMNEGFLRPFYRSLVLEASDPEDLLDLLVNYHQILKRSCLV
ncbi:MAG: TIGR00730 family Rossman fold protein [Moorea sp. SIO2B7]|nr:TIGR00730 family Rossman fold protein [Moorena sp. SIO2B7]